ncbi:Hypp2002 [Branchiostoma lanceolatum]|uniref:Hypp2002 protein n=1 Tax=Branchiostoma lanceolatum TaxID=7740 RepID=A0A8K0ENE0_BRALA|nr:Hypp2002 [Branchiostoma lanceolatum]
MSRCHLRVLPGPLINRDSVSPHSQYRYSSIKTDSSSVHLDSEWAWHDSHKTTEEKVIQSTATHGKPFLQLTDYSSYVYAEFFPVP